MKWSTRVDSGGREGNELEGEEWKRMERKGKEKERKDKIRIGNKGMER